MCWLSMVLIAGVDVKIGFEPDPDEPVLFAAVDGITGGLK